MNLRIYPRSIVRLVAAGYVLVALPLLAALVIAIFEVDRLARQGYGSTLQAEAATQLSRSLVESAIVMGRNLAQYNVLEDIDLYRDYRARRDMLRDAIHQVSVLELSPEYASRLREFSRIESRLFEEFGSDPGLRVSVDRLTTEFSELVSQGQSILAESSALVRGDAHATILMAEDLERVVLTLLATLVPLAVVIAVWLTRLIAVPIRELNRAIRQLGAGNFSSPIEVTGPRDLTELGRKLDWLRRRIVSLEQQKVTFLRHMSHELKTPLTTIREGAELLADTADCRDSAETLQITRILRDKTVQLQMLIENLLEFARTQDSNPARREYVPIRVKTLIQKVLREFALTIDNKKLDVTLRVADAEIRGDRGQMKIVLDNLISNAVKFSPPGGRVIIEVDDGDGRTAISIKDSGPGIPEAERDVVFKPFYQGAAVSSSPLKGTGLGLAIVKEYVGANGGQVEIVEGGGGAHFRIVFSDRDVRPADGE